MPEPKYTVHRPDGTPIAGDDALHDGLRITAVKVGGYITDRVGNRVYETTAGALPDNSMKRGEQNG